MAALTAAQKTAAKAAQAQLRAYPKQATAMSGSVTIGPFTIKYAFSGSSVTVTASVSFGPIKKTLFKKTLSLSQKCHSVTLSAGVAKVTLKVCVDIAKRRITITGEACVRKPLGGWSCKKFSKTIG